MSAVDVAWALLRENPGRRDQAAELARGIVETARRCRTTSRAPARCCSRPGRCRRGAGLRHGARSGRLARSSIAHLDTVCELARGDGRAARRALGTHLARVGGRVDAELVSLASQAGAPLLAWKAGARAGLGPGARLAQVAAPGCAAPRTGAAARSDDRPQDPDGPPASGADGPSRTARRTR